MLINIFHHLRLTFLVSQCLKLNLMLVVTLCGNYTLNRLIHATLDSLHKKSSFPLRISAVTCFNGTRETNGYHSVFVSL